MIEEKLIEYSTAKLAKEKGFNHIKANCFGDNMVYQLPEGILINALNGNTTSGYILAPTQSLLAKWLREVHEIIVVIDIEYIGSTDYVYIYTIKYFPEDQKELKRPVMKHIESFSAYGSTYSGGWDTYELALEAGLLDALNMIK